MPKVFKYIDKATEKPFNMAVGVVASFGKELWRRPISTTATLFMGAVILKAIDDHVHGRANDKLRAYIAEHRQQDSVAIATNEAIATREALESKQELQLHDQ